MRKLLAFASALFSVASLLLIGAIAGAQQDAAKPAASPHAASGAEEPAPPADQTYIGTTKCASCHFDQYQNWRKEQEKHAKSFDILPAKYKEDATCLTCHTTGFGEPSGFKTAADRQLAGITCESCHGPGSKHAELAKPFANKKGLQPEEKKIATDSIYRMLPQNVCVNCHSSRAHSKHPEFAKN